jgi:hypothetical protein
MESETVNDMNWTKVIAALKDSASDAQNRANLAATEKQKERVAAYDAAADMLRAMARALEHGRT